MFVDCCDTALFSWWFSFWLKIFMNMCCLICDHGRSVCVCFAMCFYIQCLWILENYNVSCFDDFHFHFSRFMCLSTLPCPCPRLWSLHVCCDFYVSTMCISGSCLENMFIYLLLLFGAFIFTLFPRFCNSRWLTDFCVDVLRFHLTV